MMLENNDDAIYLQNDVEHAFLLHRSAYHSAIMDNDVPAKALTALLPLFREHANTPAMIHHAMILIKKQTEYLHPGMYKKITTLKA